MRGKKLYCKQLRQENAETKIKEDANMKRLIALVLGLVMCLSLCAVNAESAEPVKLSIWVAENLKVEDWETNAQTLWLEEQTGLDLEFVVFGANSGDAATQVSLMVAGGEELPDIICGRLCLHKGDQGCDQRLLVIGEAEYLVAKPTGKRPLGGEREDQKVSTIFTVYVEFVKF